MSLDAHVTRLFKCKNQLDAFEDGRRPDAQSIRSCVRDNEAIEALAAAMKPIPPTYGETSRTRLYGRDILTRRVVRCHRVQALTNRLLEAALLITYLQSHFNLA